MSSSLRCQVYVDSLSGGCVVVHVLVCRAGEVYIVVIVGVSECRWL